MKHPTGSTKKTIRFRCGIAVFCALLLAAALWWFLVPRPPLLDGVNFSTQVLDRDGDLLRMGLTADDKYRVRTALDRIAPELVEATLLYEDRHFYRHWGVNPVSLLRAAQSTYLSGGRRMGASTITMQLARLRFDINTTTLWGKIQQMERAFALERHYTKREILEAYLNLAPYGGNIEGVGAAALIYFQTKAADLNLTESLSLVGVPQNPARRNPLSASKKNAHSLAGSRSRLSRIWLEAHPEDAGNAFFHSLPLAVHSPAALPFLAPHASAEAVQADSGQGRTVHTTIDIHAQGLLESRIRGFAQRGEKQGLRNACAVLLHWPSMEVRALAGSADFHDPAIQGQVDGTKARRSPGSTLKPFIYALALDQGLIHPLSLLYDAPRSFKGYDPENADGSFRGPLSAKDALVLSRNIPAIALANQLTAPDLYAFLQKAHADLPKDREEYGLSLVLGGAEITPRRLAALYALLANRGVWKEPVLFRSGIEQESTGAAAPPAPTAAEGQNGQGAARPVASGTALLSPEAAALTLDMLRDNPSVQRVHYIGQNTPKLPAYWKTGTSNGFRDAWAAGIFGPYVLVVWVGNFDGRPNAAFTGAGAAAELFLDINGALDSSETLRDSALAHMAGLTLTRIPVCADTGDINTSLCPEQIPGWFIPGVSPIADSGIYRSILVDTATGLRACVEEEGRTRRETWAFWPSDLQRMFRQAGAGKKPPPPFSPECRTAGENGAEELPDGQPPRILSPKEGLVYHRSASRPGSGGIALDARADAGANTLFWFYENRFIGRSAPGTPLHWVPPGGTGTVRVLDDFGRSASRGVRVELLP